MNWRYRPTRDVQPGFYADVRMSAPARQRTSAAGPVSRIAGQFDHSQIIAPCAQRMAVKPNWLTRYSYMAWALRFRRNCCSIHSQCGSHAERAKSKVAAVAAVSIAGARGEGGNCATAGSEPVVTTGKFVSVACWDSKIPDSDESSYDRLPSATRSLAGSSGVELT